MQPDHKILNDTEWHKAHRAIAAWKNAPSDAYGCPRCDVAGISIADNSVRPYAEWYRLDCAGCGLQVTMHLPLAPTPGASV